MAIANYFHMIPGGAGLKNGADWANAFDEPAFETHMEGAVVAGDVHFIMDGAYTLDSDINCSARDGTSASPIAIIGVKSGTTNVGAAVVYADWARAAADRPAFDGVTFNLITGDYYVVRNIDWEGADTPAVQVGTFCIVENCKIVNDYGVSAARYVLVAGTDCTIVNCEFSTANTQGLSITEATCVLFCYLHDMPDGARGYGISQTGFCIGAFNVFDECRIGYFAPGTNGLLLNSTFYGGLRAFVETTGVGWVMINNVMEATTAAGFRWATTQTDINFFWGNHGDDARCTDMWFNIDVTTIFQDYFVTTGDPDFDTPGADHSLDPGSPCLDVGMPIELGVGAATTINKGAWQNPVGGGGGGGLLVHPGMNGGPNA